MTLGSLFDGSGGFPLAGLLNGITPVWSSEIEPFPILVTHKRLPCVKHYGDVSKLFGAELEPVDIITFGSPCQDLSVAGKRAGIHEGERSSLFFQAVRIIREMRAETGGKAPRYAVWENVPGAFSSNNGEDFRAVLQALVEVKYEGVSIPRPKKWEHAGAIVGDGFSLAWRTLDAQYWGVPQRRKRIYLVADFDGERAGEIFFESESLSGDTRTGGGVREGAAETAHGFADAAGGRIVLNDQGGKRMDVSMDVTSTLRAQDHGHPPAVLQSAGFSTEHSSQSLGIGYEEEKSPMLRAGVVPAALVIENHPADSRVKMSEDGMVQTLTGRMGTGGGNVPMIAEPDWKAYGIGKPAFTSGKKANFNFAMNEEVSPTLQASGPDAVAQPTYCATTGSFMTVEKEKSHTLMARNYKDPQIINDVSNNDPMYIVRRLTPKECARLQGFPDWWCDDLATPDPSDEELAFWVGAWQEWDGMRGKKPKTERQVRKWLTAPYTDAAEYKMWGNGIALPCATFVIEAVARDQ